MKKIIPYIATAIRYLSGIILIIITAIMIAQVIDRFVFHKAIRWAEEFCAMALVVGTYIAAPAAVFGKDHTRIDFVVRAIPQPYQNYVEALTNVICAVYMGLLSRYCVPVIQMNVRNLTAVMRVPTAILSVAVLVSAILMIVFFLYNAYEYIIATKSSKDAIEKGGEKE